MTLRPHPPEQSTTIHDMVHALQRAGWSEPLSVADGGRVSVRGRPVRPEHFRIEATYRYEGITNPDDEGFVLAVNHEPTNTRGVLVTAYGPNASEDEAKALRGLRDDRAVDTS